MIFRQNRLTGGIRRDWKDRESHLNGPGCPSGMEIRILKSFAIFPRNERYLQLEPENTVVLI